MYVYILVSYAMLWAVHFLESRIKATLHQAYAELLPCCIEADSSSSFHLPYDFTPAGYVLMHRISDKNNLAAWAGLLSEAVDSKRVGVTPELEFASSFRTMCLILLPTYFTQIEISK